MLAKVLNHNLEANTHYSGLDRVLNFVCRQHSVVYKGAKDVIFEI